MKTVLPILKKIMNLNFTEPEIEELEQCKKSLIISWKSRKNGSVPRIDESFYNWCRRTKQPYVRVTLKRTSADIFMDLPNASGLLDKSGAQQFHALCSEFGFPPQEISYEKPSVEGLPREMAVDFAKKLADIGRNYCAQLEHN